MDVELRRRQVLVPPVARDIEKVHLTAAMQMGQEQVAHRMRR